MADVRLITEVDTSGVASGMAAIQNQVERTGNSIASKFSSLFGAGVLLTEFQKVLNSAEEIHKQAERFNIDAEQFQKVANAAKELGISGNTVARAMNLMGINAEKALEPNSKMAQALEDLGIAAADFAAASPWDKLQMLSAAYVTAADKGRAYADISQIVGRRTNEIIALLAEGPQKIQEFADAFPILSNAEIQALAATKEAEKSYFEHLLNWLAKAIVVWARFTGAVKAGLANLAYPITGENYESAIKQAADLAARKDYLKSIMVTPPGATAGGAAPVDITDIATGGGAGSGGGGGGGGEEKKLATLQEEMETQHLMLEEAAAGKSDLEARLVLVTKEREEGQLAYMAARDQGASQEDLLQKAVALEKVGTHELQIQDQIKQKKQQEIDAQNELNRLDREYTAEADRQLQKSKERVEIIRLDLLGQTEAGALARIVAGYEDKITAALDKALKLREQGFLAAAEEEEKLAEQLKQEEALALLASKIAMLKQLQADIISGQIRLDEEKGRIDSETAQLEQQSVDLQYKALDLQNRIDAAYATGNTELAQMLEIEKDITEQQAEQARNAAYANQLRTKGVIPGQPGTDALGIMAAEGLRMGQFDWVKDPAQRMRYEARAQLEALTGQNQFSTQERAMISANEAAWAEQQQQGASQRADKSQQQQIDYWQLVASGRGDLTKFNPFALMFGVPNFNTGTFSPLADNIYVAAGALAPIISAIQLLARLPRLLRTKSRQVRQAV